jgi:lipid-A-disaccharide synthase
MDRLAVFGLVEPLKRLPELLRIRREVIEQQLASRPSVFVGVDAPDFNLGVETRLRAAGIPTAHIVSPSVWAWRAGRIKTIARAVDLMLCLLPFEVAVYERAGIPATCVGHPLIEELAALPTRSDARQQLGMDEARTWLAVLPGSRSGEVRHLMPRFAETMTRLYERNKQLSFIIPAANRDRRADIEAALSDRGLPALVVDGQGRMAMHTADSVLLASGTATLEAMLLRRPMVIAYHMAWFSWQVLSRLATTEFVGLPNVLAGRKVVPELLQDDATPEALARAVEDVLAGGGDQQQQIFDELAANIGGGFAERCADALEPLMQRGAR